MNKIALLGFVAVTMSSGMVATGYAQQPQHTTKHAMDRRIDAPTQAPQDFQALAPSARDGVGIGGQDPLDYHLGYFRNF